MSVSGLRVFAAPSAPLLYSEFKVSSGDSIFLGLLKDGNVVRWRGTDFYPPADARILTRMNQSFVKAVEDDISQLPQSLVLIDSDPAPPCKGGAISFAGAVRPGYHNVLLLLEVGCHKAIPMNSLAANELLKTMKQIENSLH